MSTRRCCLERSEKTSQDMELEPGVSQMGSLRNNKSRRISNKVSSIRTTINGWFPFYCFKLWFSTRLVSCGTSGRTAWWKISSIRQVKSRWIFSGRLFTNVLFILDSPIIMEGWKKKKSHLLRYMKEVSKKDHRCYFIKYILCEIIGSAALVRNNKRRFDVLNIFN